MHANYVARIVDRISAPLFFGGLFVFQLLFIFQGFDFADEGSHATFYQNIFKDPESVQYTFMYWFSGIMAGAWNEIFPGLLSLRVAGVMVATMTGIITYSLLKNYADRRYVMLGIGLILLMNCSSTKDPNYNNISALLAVTTVLFLFTGIRNDRLLLLALSGVFLALATFTRLSNASGLALALVIVYSGFFVWRKPVLKQGLQLLFFLGGFGLTAAGIVLFMKVIGHYQVFANCLDLLSNMSQSDEGHYGLTNLIKLIYGEYMLGVFKVLLPAALLSLLVAWIYNHANWSAKNKRRFAVAATMLAVVVFALIVFQTGMTDSSYVLVLLFAAGSLVAALLIIFGVAYADLKLLAAAGTIMTLMLVSGSDVGFLGARAGSLWIGLPIAINYLFSVKSISARASLSYFSRSPVSGGPSEAELSPAIFVSQGQLGAIRNTGTILILAFILVFIYSYIFNDTGERGRMRYGINAPFAKGIFTTKERAKEVNDLLAASAPYIKSGDYVLAYETMPMFHALTGTRPYLRNAWPKLYDASVLATELKLALEEKKKLPVVILQKLKTDTRVWPGDQSPGQQFDFGKPRHAPIKTLLADNNYRLTWENASFQLYLPPAK